MTIRSGLLQAKLSWHLVTIQTDDGDGRGYYAMDGHTAADRQDHVCASRRYRECIRVAAAGRWLNDMPPSSLLRSWRSINYFDP